MCRRRICQAHRPLHERAALVVAILAVVCAIRLATSLDDYRLLESSAPNWLSPPQNMQVEHGLGAWLVKPAGMPVGRDCVRALDPALHRLGLPCAVRPDHGRANPPRWQAALLARLLAQIELRHVVLLGLGLALGFGVVNAMWLEASYAFGDLNEDTTCDRFVSRSRSTSATPDGAP